MSMYIDRVVAQQLLAEKAIVKLREALAGVLAYATLTRRALTPEQIQMIQDVLKENHVLWARGYWDDNTPPEDVQQYHDELEKIEQEMADSWK